MITLTVSGMTIENVKSQRDSQLVTNALSNDKRLKIEKIRDSKLIIQNENKSEQVEAELGQAQLELGLQSRLKVKDCS